MKKTNRRVSTKPLFAFNCYFLACCFILLSGFTAENSGQADRGNTPGNRQTPEELRSMPKIDAHAHIMDFDNGGEELFITLLEKHNMKWLDICAFLLGRPGFQEQIELARRFHSGYPERLAWATAFSLESWGGSDWESSTIAAIEDGFKNGAVAVKVWKDIGMVLKDPDSSFVMIDDPRFDAIFDYIEKQGKTLVAHIGEPLNCWLPIDSMSTQASRRYYSNNPQYHGYLLPDIPGYWEQVESRDRVLEKHPGLRVVGCHLGSLESDVEELAERLERYSNFAVDMAERIVHFQVQDREKVRNFFIKYQDRLLYGTDNLIGWSDAGLPKQLEKFEKVYTRDYRYFATDDKIEVPEVGEGFICRGLDLPAEVLRKIYYDNALKWYPGL